MEQPLGPCFRPGETAIPPGVDVEDGLTEDEAVALALWNNAAYQELLAELGIAGARLLDAGLLSDPQFVIFFPLGPKQLEFTAFQSIDALWLRPIRMQAAKMDLNRVANLMVQNGLDVIRDVRIAHADLYFAQERAALAREAETLRGEIAELARKRLAAGDISELEATSTQVEAVRARADAARLTQDVDLAQHRLRMLIGLAFDQRGIVAITTAPVDAPLQTDGELVRQALAMRPDLRASEINIETAGRRAELARSQFLSLEGVFDANGRGERGKFESGPGLRMSIPLFNRNRGGIALADAEVERSQRQYVALRDRIALEVRTAHTEAEQASENLHIVQVEILPQLESAAALARKNYESGDTPYFLVLQTVGQFLEARARQLELSADLKRAVARLERNVGCRLVTRP